MKMKKVKDPMEFYTRPQYRKEIDACLRCARKDCPGVCPKKDVLHDAIQADEKKDRNQLIDRRKVYPKSSAVAKILHDWKMSIGEFSQESGVSASVIYRALRGEALAFRTIQRLADALDTYPQDIME